MPTYASFTGDHHPCYLTPGKRYLVEGATGRAFEIYDDEDQKLFCLWRGCAHLSDGDWTRHDEPDAEDTESTDGVKQMQITEGTLVELNVEPGDVLEAVAWGHDGARVGEYYDGALWTVHAKHPLGYTDDICAVYTDNTGGYARLDEGMVFRVVSRASDTPPALGDMTDAEIGALVRAFRNGETIEFWNVAFWDTATVPRWALDTAYRIKAEPVRETVTLFRTPDGEGLHAIPVGTIDQIDGVFQPGTFKLL